VLERQRFGVLPCLVRAGTRDELRRHAAVPEFAFVRELRPDDRRLFVRRDIQADGGEVHVAQAVKIDEAMCRMDILGEVSHFRQVYKWLAVPPKGDHQPDASTLAQTFSHEELIGPELASVGKSRHYGAMFTLETSAIDGAMTPAISKVVTVTSGKPTEIEIPVTGGSRFSLVLFGSVDVSATLIDDKGQIVGKNLAGTAEALELFRTINVKGPFNAAKWKLRLESQSAKDAEVAIAGFVDYTSTDFR